MEFIIHHWTEKSKVKELAEYITEQLAGLEDIRKKPMMGGYIFTIGSAFSVAYTELALW